MALFTFSPFDNGHHSELNPLSDYFTEIVVFRSNTPEHQKFVDQGFVFCTWISIKDHAIAYVKPSKVLLDVAARIYGHKTDAITLVQSNKVNRIKWHGSNDHANISPIAGDFCPEEFAQALEAAKAQFNTPYVIPAH